MGVVPCFTPNRRRQLFQAVQHGFSVGLPVEAIDINAAITFAIHRIPIALST